jgi:hypothetical protein
MALCVHYMLTPFLLAFLTALLAQAYATVVKSMMHGPCGELDPKAACMENGHCTKKYPHQFQPTTMAAQDSYPLYRRTEGPTARVRGKMLDNRYGHSCACAMSIPFHVLNSRAYIVCIHIHRLHITYTQPTNTHTHTHKQLGCSTQRLSGHKVQLPYQRRGRQLYQSCEIPLQVCVQRA